MDDLIAYHERVRQLRKRKCAGLGILFSIIGILLMAFASGGLGLILLQIGITAILVAVVL